MWPLLLELPPRREAWKLSILALAKRVAWIWACTARRRLAMRACKSRLRTAKLKRARGKRRVVGAPRRCRRVRSKPKRRAVASE